MRIDSCRYGPTGSGPFARVGGEVSIGGGDYQFRSEHSIRVDASDVEPGGGDCCADTDVAILEERERSRHTAGGVGGSAGGIEGLARGVENSLSGKRRDEENATECEDYRDSTEAEGHMGMISPPLPPPRVAPQRGGVYNSVIHRAG